MKEASDENYLVAAILTSGLATTATSVGSLAQQKKVKDGSFVVIEGIQERFLEDFFFLLCIVYITNSRYRSVVPKAKNEVGSHPSHDATLTATSMKSKLRILQSLFLL